MDRATVMPEPIKPLNKFLPDVCRTADILVVAVGHPELVSPACGCPRRISCKNGRVITSRHAIAATAF